jgi:hypothetical protein
MTSDTSNVANREIIENTVSEETGGTPGGAAAVSAATLPPPLLRKEDFVAFHNKVRYHIPFLQDKKFIAPGNAAPNIYDLLGLNGTELPDAEAVQDAFDTVSDRLRRLQGQHAAAISELRTAVSMARRIAADLPSAVAYLTWYKAEYPAPTPTVAATVEVPAATPEKTHTSPTQNGQNGTTVSPVSPEPEARVQIPAAKNNEPQASPQWQVWKRSRPKVSGPELPKTPEWVIICSALGGVVVIAGLLMSGIFKFGGGDKPTPAPSPDPAVSPVASPVASPTAAANLPSPEPSPVPSAVPSAAPSASPVTAIEKIVKKRTEAIAFTTEEKQSGDMPRGRRRVQQAGKPGSAEVSVEITTQGGKEIGRRALGRRIVQSPIKEIVLVGTAAPAATPRPASTPKPQNTARTRFCSQCGEKLAPGQRFCSKTGKPI